MTTVNTSIHYPSLSCVRVIYFPSAFHCELKACVVVQDPLTAWEVCTYTHIKQPIIVTTLQSPTHLFTLALVCLAVLSSGKYFRLVASRKYFSHTT